MKLSAPIYRLRHRAKLLAREQRIPLHEALDRVANKEGFNRWSLLTRQASDADHAGLVLARLKPGELLLLGARPGHGKTMMSLKLVVKAMKSGCRSVFFSLEYNEKDIQDLFKRIGEDVGEFNDRFRFYNSDAISAEYIIERMVDASRGTVVVIDYLQLLDQKRENPELMDQVLALKSFARDQGCVIVFISQIDRSYDPSVDPCPGLKDVRLPNPLDLTLFNKACFLNSGEIQFTSVT